MGFGGISIWELLIILAIVITIFGTKRLRDIGGDLGSAIRNFRAGLRDESAASILDLDTTPRAAAGTADPGEPRRS